MKKVLILGAKGMLGQELHGVFSLDKQYAVTGWDRTDIDVTDFAAAEEKIRAFAPEIILNAIAYNEVDVCEKSDAEHQKAILLNAEVPKFLARLAKDVDAALVHYSTDYVFDGENIEGYDENATPHPICRYGKSKWEGERSVLAGTEKKYVIRLSRLFGKPASSAAGKISFFEKMLQIAKKQPEMTVVNDEWSCFTYAPDLALATKALIEDGVPYGIYHLANTGATTSYEAVVEFFRLMNVTALVKPVSGKMFPRPARRPKNTVLINTKRPLLRDYREALKEYILKP